jgi:hypothetical protein
MLLKLPVFQNKQTPKELMIVALLPLLKKKKKNLKENPKHHNVPLDVLLHINLVLHQ